MRRFDPGPRLQTFCSFPSELNGLGEIIGSLSIVSDGLKSASIGVEGGQKADTELFEVLATRPAPSRSISKRLSSNLRMACCLCSAVGWLLVPTTSASPMWHSRRHPSRRHWSCLAADPIRTCPPVRAISPDPSTYTPCARPLKRASSWTCWRTTRVTS